MTASTTIEVRGPRDAVIQRCLQVAGAVELPHLGRRSHVLKLGRATATAFWVEAEQRMVITVYGDDPCATAGRAVLGQLRTGTHDVEVIDDRLDETYDWFAVAS